MVGNANAGGQGPADRVGEGRNAAAGTNLLVESQSLVDHPVGLGQAIALVDHSLHQHTSQQQRRSWRGRGGERIGVFDQHIVINAAIAQRQPIVIITKDLLIAPERRRLYALVIGDKDLALLVA